MGTNERLFHLMAEKMREFACDTPGFKPDDEDISDVFCALCMLVEGMDHTTNHVNTAAAALGVASGEFSGDLGYYINERQDQYDYLLAAMVDDGILECLEGDNHKVYLRIDD